MVHSFTSSAIQILLLTSMKSHVYLKNHASLNAASTPLLTVEFPSIIYKMLLAINHQVLMSRCHQYLEYATALCPEKQAQMCKSFTLFTP